MPTHRTAAPSPSGARVAGAYVQPLLELAVERGVALSALAVAAGMAEDALSPIPESLAAADYVRLLDAGAELARHPHFGLHVGERVKLGTYSVYGLILLSCRDLGQAFAQTLRYESLAHDLGRSELGPDLVAVAVVDPVPTRDVVALHRRSMTGSPAVAAVLAALAGRAAGSR